MHSDLRQYNGSRRKWLRALLSLGLVGCGGSDEKDCVVSLGAVNCGTPLVTGQVTAGQFDPGSGMTTGYTSTVMGSISAGKLRGSDIFNLFDDSNTGRFTFQVDNHGTNTGQAFFTALYINGQVFTSATATFGEIGFWEWPTTAGLSNGSSYPFVIT